MTAGQELWRDSCVKLRQQLEEELQGECKKALDTEDFEGFQASVNALCQTYLRKNVSKLVREKLSPHFEHIRSFERAISMSAQLEMAPALFWAGTQAVIQSACRFSDHLDEILDQLVVFYTALPLFNEYMDLFPGNKRLEYPLRDLYDDYGIFCIHAVKYLNKNPTTNLLKCFISSKAQREQKAMLTTFQRHRSEFEKEAELAHRQHTMRASRPLIDSAPALPSTSKIISQHIVSLRRNSTFSGRDSLLEQLKNYLSAPKCSQGAEPVSCLLHGMGGIGKTQTALEYTYRYQEIYNHIFWLPAETTSELVQAYSLISVMVIALGLTSSSSTLDAIQTARTWLETTEKSWLLVFDNVEGWPQISSYWPTTSKSQSSIIITSQVRTLKNCTTHEIEVKSLDIIAGAQLLLKLLRRKTPATDEENEAAEQISTMVGGLPLAITHIGGYMGESECSLLEFREISEERNPSIWFGEAPATLFQYNKRLEAVWDFALDELPADAKTIINIMAFLNPDFIPDALLHMEFDKLASSKKSSRMRQADFISMRKSLVKRSLVTYETGSSEPYLTIHRSLQRGILYKLDKQVESRQAVFEQAFSIVRQITPSASPIQVPDPRFWSEFEAAVPQIFALRSAFLGSQPQIEGSVQFAELLYDAGFNTWEREISYSGLQLLETAEQILDDLGYDENAKLRADIHAIAGIICDNIGISRKAQGLLHRQNALKIRHMVVDEARESVTREQEILLYNAMNDVAESQLQSYGYQEAEVLVESCKVQYAKWGTEDEFPFEYGKYYRNIGAVRCLQHRFEEAITSTERAVELIGLDTGVGPRYLFYMYDSACHILQAGDLETSLKIHREIFETREDICGEFNDVTLQSAYTIGALYHHLGDPQMAEKWIRESLRRAERASWPAEPLCRAQYHLATLLKLKNEDDEEASRLEVMAREVLDRLIIYDYPDFLKGVHDDMILFDHLQPAFRGRFTGRGLLACVP